MLKIGVLGVGHLGKIHLKCIGLTEGVFEAVGYYDPDKNNAAKVEAATGWKAFESAEALIDAVDVIDIVSPTFAHFELAKATILRGKHVFIEKPLTRTLEEAKELIQLSKEHGVKVQVGHVERFNPALLAMDDMAFQPLFVETHRLATYNPRGTDVSVVLDLMIHDLDILLSMVPSAVKSVQANGHAILSSTPDIANARITFEDGCVANITASRMSMKQMRKMRIFQKDAYISLDFLDKNAQVVRISDTDENDTESMVLDTPNGKKRLDLSMPNIEPVNAIKMELEAFASSIKEGSSPVVDIKDGYRALELATLISKMIEEK